VEFYRIGRGALHGDTLWLAEPSRLLALSDGRVVRTIGNEGDGPGEFRTVSTFGFVQDALWVSDDRARRLTLFGPADEVAATHRYDNVPVPSGYKVDVLVPLGDGAIGILGSWDSSRLQKGPTPEPVLRFHGSELDTLIMAESRPHDLGMSGGMMFIQPVSERHHVAWDSRSGRAAVVRQRQDSHGPGEFTITFFDASGAAVVEKSDTFQAERLQERAVREHLASFAESPMITDEIVERIREAMFIPEFVPPVMRAKFDSLGRLWLAQQTSRRDGPIRWRVYGPDGRAEFDLLLPWSEPVLDASMNTVWTRGLGDFEVAVVREWNLIRPE